MGTQGRSRRCLAPGDVVYVEPVERPQPAVPAPPDAGDLRRASSQWTPIPAACWRWSAASRSTSPSSTAPRRRCASRARRSSPSSTPRRSTTATRPPPSCWTRRSRSTGPRPGDLAAGELRRQVLRARARCATASSTRKNLMTVRLAQDVGMPLIAEYAKRFGVYDEMLPVLAMSLGAGETTVLRMTAAYSMFVERRQADQADADRPHPGPLGPDDLPARRAPVRGLRRRQVHRPGEPRLVDKREQVLDPLTAYQITSMLRGRRAARHRDRRQGSRQAAGRQDRHDQRRQGRVVRGLLARPRGRRIHGLRQAALPRQFGRPPASMPRRFSAIS